MKFYTYKKVTIRKKNSSKISICFKFVKFKSYNYKILIDNIYHDNGIKIIVSSFDKLPYQGEFVDHNGHELNHIIEIF
jgi:hypothetical protein